MTGVLADTSVWIAHHHQHDPVLERAIADDRLWTHELVIAELALGSIPDRKAFLADLATFPRVSSQPASRVMEFVDEHSLASTGIGYVDACLLLGLSLSEDVKLWTRDKRLDIQAERLGCAFRPA